MCPVGSASVIFIYFLFLSDAGVTLSQFPPPNKQALHCDPLFCPFHHIRGSGKFSLLLTLTGGRCTLPVVYTVAPKDYRFEEDVQQVVAGRFLHTAARMKEAPTEINLFRLF